MKKEEKTALPLFGSTLRQVCADLHIDAAMVEDYSMSVSTFKRMKKGAWSVLTIWLRCSASSKRAV